MKAFLHNVKSFLTNDNGRRTLVDFKSGVALTALNSQSDAGLGYNSNLANVRSEKLKIATNGTSMSYQLTKPTGSPAFDFSNHFGFVFNISAPFDDVPADGNDANEFMVHLNNQYKLMVKVEGAKKSNSYQEIRHTCTVYYQILNVDGSSPNTLLRYFDIEAGVSTNFGIFLDRTSKTPHILYNSNVVNIKHSAVQPYFWPSDLDLGAIDTDNLTVEIKTQTNAFISGIGVMDENISSWQKLSSIIDDEFEYVEANIIKFAKDNGYLDPSNAGSGPFILESLRSLKYDEFVTADFSSASGLSSVKLNFASPNKVIKQVRALQRILAVGASLGTAEQTDYPTPADDRFSFLLNDSRLTIREAVRIIELGYVSAAQLANASENELNAHVCVDSARAIVSDDSETLKRAKFNHNNRAKFIIASARQRAHLVSLAYMNTKNLSNPALVAAQRSEEDPEITFENLYNSGEYFTVDSDRSVFSLSAYTVALKELVDTHIDIESSKAVQAKSSLAQRRPDIGDIVVSSENSSQLQPKLNMVNDLLRYHANVDLMAADLDKVKLTTKIPDKELDSIQYPLSYPFNVNYDKVDVALEDAKVSWTQLRRNFNAKAFNEYSLGMGPSLVEAIAKDNAYSNNEVTSAAFQSEVAQVPLWGLAHLPSSASGGKETKSQAYKKLSNIKRFVAQADIDESLLHQLLFADLSRDEVALGERDELYFNRATTASGDALASLVISNDAIELDNFDHIRKDRVRRFIMLSKAMSMDFVTLHRLLRATGNRINKGFLQALAAYKSITAEYQISLDEFISLIADMRNSGRGNGALPQLTYLQSVFYRPRQAVELVSESAEVKDVSWDPSTNTGDHALIRTQLANMLDVTEAEVKAIARIVVASGSVTLNSQNLSALHRIRLLARMFKFSIADMQAIYSQVTEANKLLQANASLSNKLVALELLTTQQKLFVELHTAKALELQPAELAKLSDNNARITINTATTNSYVGQLTEALSEAPKVTMSLVNKKLAEFAISAINKATFDDFVEQGIIINRSPAFLQSISPADKKAKAVSLINALFVEQQVVFERRFAALFKVTEPMARVFTSWLDAIVSSDNDKANMQVRLNNADNLVLRQKLLSDSETISSKRRYLQQAKQLAKLIAMFGLTKSNWQELLVKPELLTSFTVATLPSYQALLNLAQYEAATKLIDNQTTPLFTLVAMLQSDDAIVAGELTKWFSGSEQSDFVQLLDMFSSTSPKVDAQNSLDNLAKVVLAYQQSQQLRLKPATIDALLKIGSAGNKTHQELDSVYKQVANALQSTDGLSKQAQSLELERSRDRLLNLALFKMRARGLPVNNGVALQRYLLTDVFTGGESKSSAIKEASLSLQDFANQVLNNEVAGHNANDTFREYWEWMYSYTTWEANRRTFFEVENYLLPELRRDKTESFSNLENQFSDITTTPANAVEKFKVYAKELLNLAAMETVVVADGYPQTKDVLLIGKQQVGEQQTLFYRKLSIGDTGVISAPGNWAKINSVSLTDKETQSLSACYAFGQWHMFWLSYDLVKDESSDIPATTFASLNQSSLEPNTQWSGKKVVRKGAVPAGVSYETKRQFNIVRAYNPGAVELSGSQVQNDAMWQRHEPILTALDDKVSPLELTKVLHTQLGWTGAAWHSNLNSFREHIRNDANSSPEKSYFMPNEFLPTQSSTLKLLETNVRTSNDYIVADGITLVLPPVFGLYQGEIINPEDVHSSGLNRTSNRLQLTNRGTFWEGNNNGPQNAFGSESGVSKLLLGKNGNIKVITANKLRAKQNTAITNQEQLHGLKFGEDYLSGTGVSHLTSSGSIARLGVVAKQAEGVHHQYLLNKELKRFYRVRSHAASVLASYIGEYQLDDFMHPSVQLVSESQFNEVMQPNDNIAAPFPGDKLSFDDLNGAMFWEIFFHAPVAIASSLKAAGHYKEAEQWFHYVFNPQVDENKVGIVDQSNIRNITPLLERNSFWQTLALRKSSPMKLKGELFLLDSTKYAKFERNPVKVAEQYFNEPDLAFDVYELNFPLKADSNTKVKDFIAGKTKITYRKDKDDPADEKAFEYSGMRITGTQFLAAGNYVVQIFCDDKIAMKVNGQLVVNSYKGEIGSKVKLLNVPLTISKSGIQHVEFIFTHSVGRKALSVAIAAAQPGVELKSAVYLSDNYQASLGKDTHDFHQLKTQQPYEQRLLTELSQMDNELALSRYIDDPYNPHALAQINTNAYRIWTFYEYLDNIIKQGDVEFRKFTRESLPAATLTYNRVERLLGDEPVYRGLLDNLPSDSKLQDIANNSLLDFDGDGDIDLDDADIQAKRLIDAGRGSLQKSLELALENRLSRVSVSGSVSGVTLPQVLTEAYTGDDSSAVLLKPRYMKYEGTGANIKLTLVEQPAGQHKFLPQTFLNNSYFAIPQNQRTLGLWKTVATRLFNIRNGRNINGERVVLPLTQPTLSPIALATAAAQGGDALSNALSGVQPPIPHYRFNYAIERAESMTNMVIGYGNKLQSLYQSKDLAELEELRASYEKEVISGGKAVLQEQLKSAETAIEIVLNGYGTARYLEFKNAARKGIELTLEKAKGPHDDDAFKNIEKAEVACQTIILSDGEDKYARIGAKSKKERSKHFDKGYRDQTGDLMYQNQKEKEARSLTHAQYSLGAVIDGVAAGSNFAKVAPNIFGLAVGGSDWKAPLDGAVGFARIVNEAFGKAATELEIESSLGRRASGWEQDRQLAIQDQDELENRLIQTNHDRLAIQSQLASLEEQITKNEQIFNLITLNRVSKRSLFDLLVQGMESLYSQLYNIALSAAREAERAWVFEKARKQSFEVKDNWNNKRKGLLAGESLLLVLQQMRNAYQQENARRFEISKHISLKNNKDVQVHGSDQDAIATLKAQSADARAITFSLPSRIFDRDYPGHIVRQIKSVSITIPAVVGPYENLGATLKQLNNNVLLNNDSVAAVAMTKGKISDYSGDAIRKDYRPNQSVAISTAVNDSGMFQLNFDDPRFLPFEGTGVDSTWQLQFSELMPQAIFDSINDIIMEVRYTSEQGSVQSEVVTAIKSLDSAS